MSRRVILVLSHTVFLILTLLGAIMVWADCLSDPSLYAPGDSLMAFVAFNMLGGLTWLVAWLGTSWSAAREVSKFRREHLLLAIITLGVVCAGALRVRTLTPTFLLGNNTLLRLLFLCVLPGLRGYLSGARIAGCRPWQRHHVVGFIPVAVGTLAGATFLWWPREMVMSIACLINVRGHPSDWPPSSLAMQLVMALALAACSGAFLVASALASRQTLKQTVSS